MESIASKASVLSVFCVLVVMMQDGVWGSDRVIYVDERSANASNSSECWTGDVHVPCLTFELGLEGLYKWLTAGSYTNTATLMISKGNYSLTSDDYVVLEGLQNITIEGRPVYQHDPYPVTITCSMKGVGFAFFNSTNIILRGYYINWVWPEATKYKL